MLNYSNLQQKLTIAQYKKKELTEKLDNLNNEYQELKANLDDYELLSKLIQEAATLTLEGISIKINSIVTNALQTVLDEPYKFSIGFNIKYGKISCNMYLERDGEVYDMREQNGDGTVDIVALTLRASMLCLDRRKLRRVLILDEPAGAVSIGFQPKIGELLTYFSNKLNLQVIMVMAHGSALELSEAKEFTIKHGKLIER